MKAHGQVFKNVGSVLPRRSVFDLSYSKLLTCDMGQLIPVMCDEVVPGDHFKIGNEVVIRFQPLVAPILHQVNMYVHYFFVPYRILDEYWEEIITGGVNGNSVRVPSYWIPQDTDLTAGSLWDFLGFPIIGTNATYPRHSRPVLYPKRAYNMIYNEYYRDETLQTKVDINLSNTILLRNWSKDYFTSALPWQQRGTAPAKPIS